MAASAFVVVLPLTPHAFFAWRVIFVASGLSRCMFSLPHFWLQPVSAGIAATSSAVVISSMCPISSPREVAACCLWQCRLLASRIFDGVGEPRGWGG